eukprot:667004-Amphidinium_carterae.1
MCALLRGAGLCGQLCACALFAFLVWSLRDVCFPFVELARCVLSLCGACAMCAFLMWSLRDVCFPVWACTMCALCVELAMCAA